MKKVIIFVSDGTAASSVMGPADLFAGTGMLWNIIQHQRTKKYFDVSFASQNGNAVRSLNGTQIDCQVAFRDVNFADLVLIGSIFNIKKTIASHQSSIEHILKLHEKGSDIASICTGAFLLAETGLLDGKHATTHWGLASEFQSMYPKIRLQTDHILVDEGSILTSGGANAGSDLSLYLIERYCGKEIALQNAKFYLQDSGRTFQTPYIAMSSHQHHADDTIKKTQKWIAQHIGQSMDLKSLSMKAGLSLRTFERRFKKATSEAPLTYIQKVRVENAKHLLATTMQSFDEISYQLGYQNSGSFRKIFVKYTNLLPSDYRVKFQRIVT